MRESAFHEKPGQNRASGAPLLIIFTDLDGTLLDHDTYRWDEALPALAACKEREVPVILVSSKTGAEMDPLRRKLSLSHPFIPENGGGIFFPDENPEKPPRDAVLEGGLWKQSLGTDYDRLVEGLREIREELGWNIRGFSDMRIEEISRLTGLDENGAELAAMREYDEAFIVQEIEGFDRDALMAAAARRGFAVTEGGRFFHLQGENDKGRAMDSVVAWYRESHQNVVTVALGDSPNDFPMLERADYPVLVRSKRDFATLKERIPKLIITENIGPRGWNEAVLDILKGKEEPENARDFRK